MMDRVLGLVLAHGSTATDSLTSRFEPERLEMTIGPINANNGLYMQSIMNIPALRLRADGV